jgi:hypothetical protein
MPIRGEKSGFLRDIDEIGSLCYGMPWGMPWVFRNAMEGAEKDRIGVRIPGTRRNAGKGDVYFVETDVDLNRDGSAVVAYTVQWRVVGDRLRGFVFSGNDRLRVGPFSEKSHAVDDAGNRYDLEINRMQPDVYEILLAGGQGVRSGHVTYRFWFPTNFAQAGYVEPDHGRGRAGTGGLQLVAGAVGRGGAPAPLHPAGAYAAPTAGGCH